MTGAITERELAFALNYHSDDTRINDADWKIARRYFEVIEANRGTHPSLATNTQQAPEPEPERAVLAERVKELAYEMRTTQRKIDGIASRLVIAVAQAKAAPETAPGALTDERFEAAYWEFDARRKGYVPFKDAPESERDAFKHAIRRLLAGEEAIP